MCDIKTTSFIFMNNNNRYIDLTKYEIVTRVGKGSFGKVYKIRNTESQQIYAAKVALESIEEINDHEKKVIYNEIKIISKINHPCFVKFYGYNPYDFNNENKPVIVTEYLPNGSLKKLINDEIEGNAPQEYTYTKKNNYIIWYCCRYEIFMQSWNFAQGY